MDHQLDTSHPNIWNIILCYPLTTSIAEEEVWTNHLSRVPLCRACFTIEIWHPIGNRGSHLGIKMKLCSSNSICRKQLPIRASPSGIKQDQTKHCRKDKTELFVIPLPRHWPLGISKGSGRSIFLQGSKTTDNFCTSLRRILS